MAERLGDELAGPLGRGVDGDRTVNTVCLREGNLVIAAIDGGRRGEDNRDRGIHACDAVKDRGLAGHVGPHIGKRVLRRIAHARLGCEMHDDIRCDGECVGEPRIVHVGLDEGEMVEARQFREAIPFQPDIVIGIEIVETGDPVAALKKRPGDMIADEAGRAGQENRPHGRALPSAAAV